MDWNLAIEKNREALTRIVAMLVAMVAVNGGSARGQFTFFPHKGSKASGQAQAEESKLFPAPTLPRHLHRFVLRLLRPAEAAARRLVIIAARGLVVELGPRRAVKPKPQSIFVRDGVGTGVVRHSSRAGPMLVPSRPASLSLPLFDPLKRWGVGRRPKQHSVPRITFDFDRPREPDPLPSSPDDPLGAGRLHRRLEAIGRALDDLPKAAERLARWQARLDAVVSPHRNNDVSKQDDGAAVAQSASASRRFQRISPMRPGRPPGWRRLPSHAVHEVLTELHGLAVWAREHPDTS